MSPALSAQDAWSRIVAAEERWDLLRHTVEGWSVWPLVRPEVAVRLTGLASPGGLRPRLAGRLWRAIRDVPEWVRPRRARHFVLTYSSGFIEKTDGCYWDIWFDDILQQAGSAYKVESVNSISAKAQSDRAAIPRSQTTAALELYAGLRCRWASPKEAPAAVKAFSRALSELGLGSDHDSWLSWRISRFAALTSAYRRLLSAVQPQFVLVADPYEHHLVAASKELRVPVLELQHGVVSGHHPGYAWSEYAAGHRGRMPVADRLLLYGEHWRSVINSAFWADRLGAVGNPRLDRYRRAGSRPALDVLTILVTAQGLDGPQIAAFLRGALETVAGRGVATRLVVKLHPSYDADREAYVTGLSDAPGVVEVLSARDQGSTLAWLGRAHVHASVGSASHYDAVGMGVPTVVLPFSTSGFAQPLVNAGHATLTGSPAEFAEAVLGWQDLVLPEDVRYHYFAPAATRNVLRELGLSSYE